MSKSRITIKDLARELNISTSTVSRALADRWDVSPETRKAVVLNYETLSQRCEVSGFDTSGIVPLSGTD